MAKAAESDIVADRNLTVQELSDRVGIQDLLIRYSTAINDKNLELLDSCFSPDARCDYSAMDGPNDSYRVFRVWIGSTLGHTAAALHRVTNIQCKIEGDSAVVRSMYTNPRLIALPDGSQRPLTVGGYYQDDMIFGSDGWRIINRVDVPTYHAGKFPSREEIERILASQPEGSAS